jgi:endonuclease YncB( thermonuclease family)
VKAALLLALLCWTVAVTEVRAVVDGDTFRARVEVWPGILADETIRVLGVDTPEMRGGSPESREAARRATEFTRAWLAQGPVMLWVCRRDHFGRVLGRVYRGDSVLADELVHAGHGAAR